VEAFDGGAFVTVRLNAEKAELKFWAAGGSIYPGWNVHDKMPYEKTRKQQKAKIEEEMPDPIEWDPASIGSQKFLQELEVNVKTKLLYTTDIKSRVNSGGEYVEGEEEDGKKKKRI
jgi:hypothetical protein